MKKRITIITAIMSLVICIALITGVTFAALSSESAVNIAISTGSVNVEAYIDSDSLSASSVVWDREEGAYKDVAAEIKKTETEEGVVFDPAFSNGGQVVLNRSGGLELKNMTGGDKLTFTIRIENKNATPALFRTIVNGGSGAFVIGVGGVTGSGEYVPYDWAEIAGKEVKEVTVTVSLPTSVEGSNVADCNMQFTVRATQINANVQN